MYSWHDKLTLNIKNLQFSRACAKSGWQVSKNCCTQTHQWLKLECTIRTFNLKGTLRLIYVHLQYLKLTWAATYARKNVMKIRAEMIKHRWSNIIGNNENLSKWHKWYAKRFLELPQTMAGSSKQKVTSLRTLQLKLPSKVSMAN